MPADALPTREEIALLPPFERLGLDRIEIIASEAAARRAEEDLRTHDVWGFDTESRPTFRAGETSDGPHLLQLATLERAYLFQLHDAGCRAVVAGLMGGHGVVKAGFGLQDDRRHIVRKLGLEPTGLLDLDHAFRQRGYRRQVGVKTAVAVLFGQRFTKSHRATTSNWASQRLTEAQVLYAANDAWAALRVYHALGLGGA
ncbi:3'-5' exonuclease [Ramlibacter sp.]|uniref:3'-5' exonuclease n=1 Tax=Ramlibacter sp. TaxID=1917967 RepID=UPI0035B3C90A